MFWLVYPIDLVKLFFTISFQVLGDTRRTMSDQINTGPQAIFHLIEKFLCVRPSVNEFGTLFLMPILDSMITQC